MMESWGMTEFTKLSVQVPGVVRDLFVDLKHGHKQLACTAGLLWYFNADERTQRLYRDWARAIAEGYATIEEPPDTVSAVLRQKSPKSDRGRKKAKR